MPESFTLRQPTAVSSIPTPIRTLHHRGEPGPRSVLPTIARDSSKWTRTRPRRRGAVPWMLERPSRRSQFWRDKRCFSWPIRSTSRGSRTLVEMAWSRGQADSRHWDYPNRSYRGSRHTCCAKSYAHPPGSKSSPSSRSLKAQHSADNARRRDDYTLKVLQRSRPRRAPRGRKERLARRLERGGDVWRHSAVRLRHRQATEGCDRSRCGGHPCRRSLLPRLARRVSSHWKALR